MAELFSVSEVDDAEASQSLLSGHKFSPATTGHLESLRDILSDLRRKVNILEQRQEVQSKKFDMFFEEMRDFIRIQSGKNGGDSETQHPTGQNDSEYAQLPTSPGQRETHLQGRRFVSINVDGICAELTLPETVIFQLEGMPKERNVIMFLLKLFFPIPFLRNCTLTGTGKRIANSDDENGTTTRDAFPAEKVILIQEAVKKIFPPTKDEKAEEGQKLIRVQKERVRNTIRSCLQYFRTEYDEQGNVKKDRHQKRQRQRSQPTNSV